MNVCEYRANEGDNYEADRRAPSSWRIFNIEVDGICANTGTEAIGYRLTDPNVTIHTSKTSKHRRERLAGCVQFHESCP